ncbi:MULTISPECIES: hypothetical protein [unclassified Microbacterium]
MTRYNDDPAPVSEDEDPNDDEATDGLAPIELEADLDNLMKGS